MNFMRELVKMAEPVQSMVFAPDEDNGEVQSSDGGRFLQNYHMIIVMKTMAIRPIFPIWVTVQRLVKLKKRHFRKS